jgi:hypothetical protein
MRYLILENNIVVNAINATQEFIDGGNLVAIQSDTEGDIGDTYENGGFIKPEPVKVFEPVKPAYMRMALRQAGILNTINSILSQDGYENARDAFEYTLIFLRDDAMVNQVGIALGLTESQIDDIFINGANLQNQ